MKYLITYQYEHYIQARDYSFQLYEDLLLSSSSSVGSVQLTKEEIHFFINDKINDSHTEVLLKKCSNNLRGYKFDKVYIVGIIDSELMDCIIRPSCIKGDIECIE